MSNVNVTPGTGKTVATETIGGVEFQQIKIMDGKTGSSSVLSFVNNGLAVPVSVMGTIIVGSIQGSLPAGTAQIGAISSIIGSLPAGVALIGGITSVIGAHTLYAQPDSFVFGVSSQISKLTADSVLSAPGASLRNFITQITVTNGSATATHVVIKDSGAGIIHGGYAAASGGGFSASFPVPLRQATTNASIDMISSAQASITTAISGYKAA